MNFGQLQTEVRRRLGDATTAFFSAQDIKDAINEAYAEMADATEFYEREANLNTIAGHTYYNLLNILPDTFLSPRRIYNPTLSRWLIPTDARQLDYYGWKQWELIYGPPEKLLMRGNWWLGVWPRTTDDVPILRVYHTAIPPPLTADSDTPAFPQEFHKGLVDCAESDLMSQQRETTKALKLWASYKAIEAELSAYVQGRTKLAGTSVL